MNESTTLIRLRNEVNAEDFALRAIALGLGLTPNPTVIQHELKKNTTCGAVVEFHPKEIVIGIVVNRKGHVERVSTEGVPVTQQGIAALILAFWEAVERCEEFHEEHA